METMRQLAIAVEEYSIDNDVYPGPSNGFVAIDFLASLLVPAYLAELPTTDGWGRDFLFWSNGVEYVMISQGGDGVGDRGYAGLGMSSGDLIQDSICGGATTGLANDIVLLGGAFCQWPAIP